MGCNEEEDPAFRPGCACPRRAYAEAPPTPTLRGRTQKRRRVSAARTNLLMTSWPERPARLRKTKNRTLRSGGNCYLARAGGKPGLVGFHRLRLHPCRRFQSARGALLIKTSHPVRIPFGSERHQPRSLFGALRGVPAEGVAGDGAAAHAQGKAIPTTKIFLSYICSSR